MSTGAPEQIDLHSPAVAESAASGPVDTDAILESLAEGVLVLDLAGRVVRTNPAADRMLGVSSADLAGMDVHEIMRDSHKAASAYPGAECPVCRTARTEEVTRVGHDVFWRNNRTSFPVEYAVAPLKARDGTYYLVLNFSDQSHGAIHAPEMLHVLASAECLLWYADVQYVREKDRLRWFIWPADVDAALRFLPIPITEGQSFAEAFYAARLDEDKERTTDFGKSQILAGRSYSQEYRCRREDGQIRWISERVQVEPVAEDRWRAAGVCTDITELKLREQEIALLNQKLQRAMTETHHRVKNNLQVISAMIDLQTMDQPETVPLSEFKRLGAHVRTLAAVHDLLTGEAKQGRDIDALSARAMLEKLLSMAAQTLGSRKLEYRIEDATLSSRQATALAVITNELISNAAKHGRGPIEVAFVNENGRATLRVTDDGPGFPAGFDAARAANTGLELVINLAHWDLGGSASFHNKVEGPGAVTEVTFKPKG